MTTLEHLAAGDKPSLKPRSDWPISAGNWEVYKDKDNNFCVGSSAVGGGICTSLHVSGKDARFIASWPPLVEKAWEEYQYHYYRSLDLDFEITENQEENGEEPDEKTVSDYKEENARALYWLTWLDTGGFLNWAGKEKE